MRRLVFLLQSALLTAFVCENIGNCGQCTITYANLLGNCRWCPLDNQCHTPGTHTNACKDSQNIVDNAKCPARTYTTDFSKQDAVRMTQYSRAAYAETAEVEGCAAISKTFLEPSFTCLKTVTYKITYNKQNLTVLSYYGYDKATNRIVWAFRGSVDTQALWEALITLLEPAVPHPSAPTAMVNPFFIAGAKGLVIELGGDYAWLKQLQDEHPTAEVFLTGHSLGGAMASLVATDLGIKKIVSPVLYTFGQPRTGDGNYASIASLHVPRSYRVVNANDPVPHLPLCKKTCDACNYGSTCDKDYACCSLNASYVHHSSEYWFPGGEYANGVMCGYSECLASAEDPSCSNKYLLSALYDLAAHSAYWNALAGYCNAAPLGAQPSYTTAPPSSSLSPHVVLAVILGVFAVTLVVGGAVLCLRPRRATSKMQVDAVHLLDSFSAVA